MYWDEMGEREKAGRKESHSGLLLVCKLCWPHNPARSDRRVEKDKRK